MNIVITGGSSGIGAVLTQYAASYVGTVYTCARRKENPHAKNRDVVYHSVDLSSTEDRNRFIEALPQKIDVLVLNAGIVGIPEVDGSANAKDLLWKINVEANEHILPACLPRMAKKGKIVFISSSTVALEHVDEPMIPYIETKRYMEQFLQKHVPEHLKLLILRPGVVATPLHHNLATKAGGVIGERHTAAKENKTSYKPLWIAYVIYLWMTDFINLNRVHTITPQEAARYEKDYEKGQAAKETVLGLSGTYIDAHGNILWRKTFLGKGIRLATLVVLAIVAPQVFEGYGILFLFILFL